MTLSRLLPVVLLSGAATVVLTASDVLAGSRSQVAGNPVTRLGAQLSRDLTQSQRDVSEKARGLEMQQRMLQATSNRIQAQAQAAMPPAAQPTVQGPQQQYPLSTVGAGSILNLVKVYQSMKPKAAAQVFEQLDLEIQVAVASNMRSQATAAIMNAMSPGAATRLTTALARPDQIPALERSIMSPGEVRSARYRASVGTRSPSLSKADLARAAPPANVHGSL